MMLARSMGFAGALMMGVVSVANAGAVGDNPAQTAEILAAVSDCAKAVTPGKADAKLLKDSGWQSGGGGKSKVGGVPVEKYYFGKQGGNVINVIQITGGLGTSCTTIAKLEAASQLDEVRAGLARQFGVKPFAEYPGDIAFKAFLMKSAPAEAHKVLIGDQQRFTVMSASIEGKPSLKIMMTPKRAPK